MLIVLWQGVGAQCTKVSQAEVRPKESIGSDEEILHEHTAALDLAASKARSWVRTLVAIHYTKPHI